MKCSNCNSTIDDDAKYCSKCGVKTIPQPESPKNTGGIFNNSKIQDSSPIEDSLKNTDGIFNNSKIQDSSPTEDSLKNTSNISLYIKPKLWISIFVILLLSIIFKISFLLTVFLLVGLLVFLLLKHSDILIRNNLISDKFDFNKVIKNGYKGKAILYGIIFFEIILLYNFVTTHDFYHQYKFQNEVIELIETNDNDGLNNVFRQVVESGSKDSLLFIITTSMDDQHKPLRYSIASEFSSLSNDVQDTVIKYFLKYQISIFSNESFATRLIESNFNLQEFEKKALVTNEKSKVKDALVLMLKKTVTESDYPDMDQFLHNGFKYRLSSDNYIYNITNTIKLFRSYFKPPDDGFWQDIQFSFREVDTLRSYYSNIKTSIPDKPTYNEPSYDGYTYTYLSGIVVPYDGVGILVVDYPKCYIVTGVEKDLEVYFQSYVIKTDRTISVQSRVNGNTWDAKVCEYVTEEEYNESVSAFEEKKREALHAYNEEMKEYQDDLSNYYFFQRNGPLIKKKIGEKLLSIKTLFGKITL